MTMPNLHITLCNNFSLARNESHAVSYSEYKHKRVEQSISCHGGQVNIICLFLFDSLLPSQQFFNHVGMGLPGLSQYSAEDKVSCSRIKDTMQCLQ